ncbi:hypothetical protein [Methanobrevibacter sp. DSM 116169]|uniref:hypothetical protein n=1 Tax=Methanobrevibacter sp. DSM 116169 TaxID=3242727 RepID=UPI0038FCC403
MKYGKGTVKKYSREYVRTLKDGKKKKYKTEQIQITVSKHDDIYENDEEVIIIPIASNDNVEKLLNDNSSTSSSTQYIEDLQYTIDTKNSTIKEYKEKVSSLENDLKIAKEEKNNLENTKSSTINSYDSKISTLENQIKILNEEKINNIHQKDSTINSYKSEINSLKNEIKLLKKENYNSNHIMKSYDELKSDFINVEKELEEVKNNDSYNKSIIEKYKRFILETTN